MYYTTGFTTVGHVVHITLTTQYVLHRWVHMYYTTGLCNTYDRVALVMAFRHVTAL